ncbi:sugar ABC transporter substrate-binding protein [Phytohabitans rumicis]|uniref:Sugar ABC transporter substrate-binding protein n=1 Tax=Phytohabitans rumicis TaxID=1076125 RepID=A0A6V8KXR5_9ACTN|nr:sugar ABC transporter substrate-binding protein [Phytohabitans rumicis]GFJ88180.1 sugar ABC transporter substrate-binding protein [Phytohabitans rumicis]
MAQLRKAALLGLITAVTLGVAACGNDDDTGGGATTQTTGLTIAVITHSDGTDNFWPVVKNGAEAAGKQLGVTIDYTFSGDPLKQSQLIDDAVAKKVAGIAVSLPNADALRAALQKAQSAGIAVVTLNSGQNQSASVGAIAHVGQDEKIAGQGAGERLKVAGVKNLLCLIHEAGNIGLTERCAGVAETLGGKVTNQQVNVANLTDVSATVSAKLQADKSIDGVIALNPGVATAALAGMKEAGTSAKLATFDLSPDVISSIQAGDMLFAVDQQQYLQGYLPVQILYLNKTNLNTVGGGQPILTGPGFVTKENAGQVADLTKKGTR